MDFPDCEVEFQQAWSVCSGELNGLGFSIGIIKSEAQDAFIDGKDEYANKLRILMKPLNARYKVLVKELNGYVEEDKKRSELKKKPK